VTPTPPLAPANRFPFLVEAAVPLYLARCRVSESPFRRLCRRLAADVVVTEFLSAEGIRRENEATLANCALAPTSDRSVSRYSALMSSRW